MEKLEINKYLPEIKALIDNNDIVSVVAPTGYGKTIGIPAKLGNDGIRVFVSVPTKASVRELVKYQRNLQGNKNINFVSSAYDGKVNYDNSSMIIYATAGHIRRKMVSEFHKDNIDFCKVLFIDEVHNQTIDVTMILTLWKEAKQLGKKVPKLLMASATPIDIFSDMDVEYFRLNTIRKYPTTIKYMFQEVNYNSDEFTDIVVQLTYDIHTQTSLETGDIMVFLPGLSEIEEVGNLVPEFNNAVKLNLYGSMSDEEAALLNESFPGKRKIIFATNAAESSITIEGLGYIIDTMLEKRMEMTSSGGTRLVTQRICKDSAIQRAGRTGRTMSGIIFRLITEDQYTALEDHTPRDIDVLPIYEPILELISISVDPHILNIKENKINISMKLLEKLNIVEDTVEGMIITEIGDFAVSLPLSVKMAAFLFYWWKQGYNIYQGCVVAALIDCYGPSYFYLPRKNRELSERENQLLIDKYKIEYFSKYQGSSSLDILLNLWEDLFEKTRLDKREVRKYNKDNSINNKKISEAINIFQQCFRSKYFRSRTIDNNFNTLLVKSMLFPIFNDNIMIQVKGKKYKDENGLTYTLDEKERISKDYYETIVAILKNENKNRDHVSRTITLSFPVKMKK